MRECKYLKLAFSTQAGVEPQDVRTIPAGPGQFWVYEYTGLEKNLNAYLQEGWQIAAADLAQREFLLVR